MRPLVVIDGQGGRWQLNGVLDAVTEQYHLRHWLLGGGPPQPEARQADVRAKLPAYPLNRDTVMLTVLGVMFAQSNNKGQPYGAVVAETCEISGNA